MSTARPATPDRSRIQDILPLSPVQEALLLGTLGARGTGEDPGFLQLRCTLRGELDETAFRAAWQIVADRHAALRSSVHWQDAARPLQVVERDVALSLSVEDWRDGGEGRIAGYLQSDRARGLDLTRAPAMRLALARTGRDEWSLIWTCHHVLLDGWSGALVLGEVAAAYVALCGGSRPRLPPVRSLREYAAWLRRQDDAQVEPFWRDALEGLDRPTPLPFDRGRTRRGHARTHGVVTRRMTSDASAALTDFARRQRVTPGTLLHAAWAIVLAGFADAERVCFGMTVSGRTTGVSGIDAMVGAFSNALPVALTVTPAMAVGDFVRAVQSRLVPIQSRAHDAPGRVQGASAVPGTMRLFESLVVVENFPSDLFRDASGRLRWQDLRGGITSNHALVVVAAPGQCLELSLLHDPERIDAADAATILDAVGTVLVRMADTPAARVAQLLPSASARTAPAEAEIAADHDVPPEGELELRLWKVWERVLGTDAFGVEDDFFDVGGYSLAVARLLGAIEATFGVRMPVGKVFESPTVRTMARAIAALDNTAVSAATTRVLVTLADGTVASRPPLFLLHGLRGDVTDCYHLVRHLGVERRIIGIQSEHPPASGVQLEDLAARYAAIIRDEQPHGPYFLGGYCFGGALAYETARQLAADGAAIGRVVVIDGDARMPRWPLTSRWMLAYWNLQLTPRGQRAAVLRRKVRKALRMLAGRSVHEEADAPGGTTQPLQGPFITSYRGYVPRPFPVPVTVILAQNDPPGLVRWRRARWSALLGASVDIHDAPGTHYTLMGEPYVRGVAERLRACLDAAAPPRTSEPPAQAHAQVARLDGMEVNVLDPAHRLHPHA